MITDLFSHKIHSSGDTWPEKLAELAAIFSEFDGLNYDRKILEERLQKISPRASYFAEDIASKPRTSGGRLDVSKFRDEISAYPAYLGIYFLEQSPRGWLLKLSETAKRFLIREEPDVASFLRLQLPLFQYPNAMGAAYRRYSNHLRIQTNVRDRTLSFISQGIHLSPVRTIVIALKADAKLRNVDLLNASIYFNEIFGLINCSEVNQVALPSIDTVANTLQDIRDGKLGYPIKYENRFHILRHTEFFSLTRNSIHFREGVNEADTNQLIRQINAIVHINNVFQGFDYCSSENELQDVIASGEWGRYFDGVKILNSHIVEALTQDKVIESTVPSEPLLTGTSLTIPQHIPEIYAFRDRTEKLPNLNPYDRRREIADPEITKIKLQRRNLVHKELIDKMESWLRNIGANPKENEHIDLFAKIPGDGYFIFEMKSGGDSLLEQIRKGLSQLYEYRYRYRSVIDDPHISLCLVLPENPITISWVTDYLCNDREINICWFDEQNTPLWPDICTARMAVLHKNS